MTKLEITSAIANLETKYSALKSKGYELERKRNSDFHSYLEPQFKLFNILDFNCYLYVSDNYFYIKRKVDEDSWDKELITVSAREEWMKKSEIRYSDLSTSFYSTSENSQFELERMIIIGRTAQMLLEKKEDILSNLNQIYENFNSMIWPIREETYEYERQIKALNEILNNIEIEDALSMLENGVNLENHPKLHIRANEERYIKYLKLIELKGKSAYIEYISTWDGDRITIERVKLDVFKSFIKRNLDDILNKVETKA
jgi:exonuclease VII small subunit